MSDNRQLRAQLKTLDVADPEYAVSFVDCLLAGARRANASDIHLQPAADGLDVRLRLNGVLQQVGCFPRGNATSVVVRLKVLAKLLTYRTDVPQEGRIRQPRAQGEMRVSTFPTLYGERAVVRLFAAEQQFKYPGDLGLPNEITAALTHLLYATSGALIVAGPAGSGKTTTAYACLRELVQAAHGGKSIVSLEDPIEVPVDGVAQAQVHAGTGFDMATGLRSIMRQDPEVILVGEIRDRDTAKTVFQAALTGHLVVTSFHAGSAPEALSRLADMGIEPYVLRGGVLAVVAQRLVRRLCRCALPVESTNDKLGLPVQHGLQANGCDECSQTGYLGRFVVAEMLRIDQDPLGDAILSQCDAKHLQTLAMQMGMTSCWQQAIEAVEQGRTSPEEVRRVFGFPEE